MNSSVYLCGTVLNVSTTACHVMSRDRVTVTDDRGECELAMRGTET
jgi:hypothetical protein